MLYSLIQQTNHLIMLIRFILIMFKYIKLANILGEVVERGQQLKNVLYHSTTLKKSQIPSALSMLSLIVNNYAQFSQYYELICQKTKLQISNPHLLMVMTAQLLNTGKIVGGGKLKKIVLQNSHLAPTLNRESKINKQTVQIRLRMNTTDNQDIYRQVSRVGEQDTVVPQLFNLKYQDYSNLTKNKELDILYSPLCVMQSFSSSLPAFLLFQGVSQKWKHRHFDVIDACAAPGNKTIQAAEYLSSKGTVFAFQKDARRHQILNQNIVKYQCSNIETTKGDFLQVKNGPKYKKVKFILLDPSCSGSGMLTNFIRDSNMKPIRTQQNGESQSFEAFCLRKYSQLNYKQRERVQKLHQFQVSLLNHASRFKPKRISYSTCSIYKRENEDVVEKFLASHPQYRLKKINVNHRDVYSGFGKGYEYCLRVDPRGMYSDGFFVSILTMGSSKDQQK